MKSIMGIMVAVVVLSSAVYGARVDIEAEKFVACNADVKAPAEPSDRFSGGSSLTLNEEEPIRMSYTFEAPESGAYTLRVREFYPNGRSTLRWRVDDGSWTTVKQTWGLMPSARIDGMIYSDWGEIHIKKGTHTLEVETVEPVMRRKPIKKGDQWYSTSGIVEEQGYKINIDVFVLTTEPLIPVREVVRLFKETGSYKPYTPKDAEDWYELPMDIDDGSDSILDLIHPTEKPIGKGGKGILRRDGAQFEYADGRPFHIWGISVPTAPPKHDAEYLARRCRRLGITLVRLHSLDGGLCDLRKGKNYVFDEAKFDQMEYLIACMRKEGIYVIIDPLYNWQAPMVGEADGLPKDAMIRGRVKCQFYIDPYLQELNKDFIRKILTHKNPYTGMENGADPAVAFFHVVNENSIFLHQIDGHEGSEHWAKMLTDQYNEWLIKEYGSREKLAEAWGNRLKPNEDPVQGTVARLHTYHIRGEGQRVSDNARFLYEVQTNFYNSVKDYITKNLGYDHILFNGSGWFGSGWLDTLDIAANLPGMDFYDQHGYGGVRYGILNPDNDPTLYRWPRYSLVEKFASRSPAGYPMTVSEWNNSNGVDGPMVMACYGALNGWDGLFQYTTKFWFDGWRDSRAAWAQAYLQYPLASLAFVRRHISEADTAWRYVTPPDKLFDGTRSENPHHTPIADLYPIIGKCEWVFGEGDPMTVDKEQYIKENGEFVDSMTGELRWRRSIGQLQIRAPKLQGLVGEADGSNVDLGDVEMRLKDTGMLSVCIASVDGRPIGKSGRMMLSAVGETKAPGDHIQVYETFDAAALPREWGDGTVTGKGDLQWTLKNAQATTIGRGPAVALKPAGGSSISVKMPTGAQMLRFQCKALEAGDFHMEVLVDGKPRNTPKVETIKNIDEPRDVIIRNLNAGKPGAEITIRTSAKCNVPVGVDNVQITPGSEKGMGDQLVMRPPVGDIVFDKKIKAAYALDLSGKRTAEVSVSGGKTIRLDNTHGTPWFEVIR